MKKKIIILTLLVFYLFNTASYSQSINMLRIEFYGDTIELPLVPSPVDFNEPLSQPAIQNFIQQMDMQDWNGVINSLLVYKEKQKPDDWLYYQLIRKIAQQFSPKTDNYIRYTLYKWYFLSKTGYNSLLTISNDKILFYVQSDETIYNIPYRIKDGKQFVCLNYHDYGYQVDFETSPFSEVAIAFPQATQSFSYRVKKMPPFNSSEYQEKELQFSYQNKDYHFRIRLNPQVKTLFANYPSMDYEAYFNMPLSQETYSSFIPLLRKNLKGMSVKNGVDFIMHFTRYAFLFKPDQEVFGQEKRLTPEQTLLYENSDCEDRAALFFFLVKEIYNLPMLVLEYPQHVTVAVQFDKAYGTAIAYNGQHYSVCEPTPQKNDLHIGQLIPELTSVPYQVAYAYAPSR